MASPWSRFSAKQYILAALLGAVVVAVVVGGITISLAPARIVFSIANATTTSSDNRPDWYNFTLVANNTSRHMSVSYGYLTAEIWYSQTGWVPAEVNTTAALPGWQRPVNTTDVAVSAKFWEWSYANGTANKQPQDTEKAGITGHDYLVVVETKVWFRFLVVPTKPYTVRVICSSVNFFVGTNFPVNCTG